MNSTNLRNTPEYRAYIKYKREVVSKLKNKMSVYKTYFIKNKRKCEHIRMVYFQRNNKINKRVFQSLRDRGYNL